MIGSWRGPGGKFLARDPRFATIKNRSMGMDRKITASQIMVETLRTVDSGKQQQQQHLLQ